MAQNILQVGNSTIWFDDVTFRLTDYDIATGRIDIVRNTGNILVCKIYAGNVIHWITPPAAASVVAAFGGVRVNLT